MEVAWFSTPEESVAKSQQDQDHKGVVHHEYTPQGQTINKAYHPQCSSSAERCSTAKLASTMGNRWLAAASGQCTQSCISSRAEFFGKTWNHSSDSVALQPRFGALQLLAFPKTKITFGRGEIQTINKIQENTTGQRMVMGRAVWNQGAYFEGDWGIIVLCTMFLVSSSIKVSFSYYVARYFLDNFVFLFHESFTISLLCDSTYKGPSCILTNLCFEINYALRL